MLRWPRTTSASIRGQNSSFLRVNRSIHLFGSIRALRARGRALGQSQNRLRWGREHFAVCAAQRRARTLLSPRTGQTSCSPCQDAHVEADVTSDTNPLLGTTGGNTIALWTTPYKSEVLGIATDGSQTIARFCKTYSSGDHNTGFQAEYGIGVPSQDRTVFFFTSDMLGQLGVIASGANAGLNRWDIFACGLIGQ